MLVQADRIAAQVGFDWATLPPLQKSIADVRPDAVELRLYRERSSHRGVCRLQRLQRLWAHSVNQSFLDEICELRSLKQLYIDRLSVSDPSSLTRLRDLRSLIIVGGTKVESLDWTGELTWLRALALENFPRVGSLQPLARLNGLRALGVEGSMWTTMKVDSLQPLSSLANLEYLFLTNLRSKDRSLQALHSLTGLKVLECANRFAKGEMERLREALPNTRCQWFDMLAEYGTIDAGVKAAVSRMIGESDS